MSKQPVKQIPYALAVVYALGAAIAVAIGKRLPEDLREIVARHIEPAPHWRDIARTYRNKVDQLLGKEPTCEFQWSEELQQVYCLTHQRVHWRFGTDG